MSPFGEFLCVELKRSVASALPQDIPWYDPSHAVFFGALYAAIAFIGVGLVATALITFKRLKQEDDGGHH
jgi:hypothetical protein